MNRFVSKKLYECDTNEYLYWKICEYIRIFVTPWCGGSSGEASSGEASFVIIRKWQHLVCIFLQILQRTFDVPASLTLRNMWVLFWRSVIFDWESLNGEATWKATLFTFYHSATNQPHRCLVASLLIFVINRQWKHWVFLANLTI